MTHYSPTTSRRRKATLPDTGPAQLLAKDGNLDELKAQWKAKTLTLADLNATDKRGDTALLYAVFNNRAPVWEWLIKKGADIRQANHKGDTVLHHIAGRFNSGENHLEDLKRLIALGADINARNALGETPVLREALRDEATQAGKWAREDHMKALAQAGADLTVVMNDGRNLDDLIGPKVGEWIAEQRVAKAAKAEPIRQTMAARARMRP